MKTACRFLPLICFAAITCVAGTASAAITITVDPSTKMLSFTGSDTGDSMDLAGIVQIASWDFGSGSGTNESVNVASAFDQTFTNAANLIVIDGNLEDGLRLILVNDGDISNAFTDVTTNATLIDYSGLSPTYIAILESFGSDTLTLNQGTGYSGISLTSIPEPGTVSLIFAGLALAFLGRRR